MLSATNQPDPALQLLAAPDAAPETCEATAPSPLCLALAAQQLDQRVHCGVLTPRRFTDVPGEIDALLRTAGVSDLGWRAKIRVTGTDRVRWMNGMVSNTVQALPEGHGNYSFLLSVQGRIQGDGWVYRRAGDLLFDTGADQLGPLLKHLDHFIIMDDVELADVSSHWTALALAGPAARQVLATLGIPSEEPGMGASGLARMSAAHIGEVACILIEAPSLAVPRFEVWFAPEHALSVWETLQAAGAQPCGLEATEALRVLEATPLYGADLNDRDLPQETAQTRALNFSKGCYLGQEIVERIRSRGKVNRQFRQFSLQGTPPLGLPADLLSAGQPVGRISTIADVPGAGLLALGFIRQEVADRLTEITYSGGVATLSDAGKTIHPSATSSN